MEILKSKYLPWGIAIVLLILLMYVGCDKQQNTTTTIETKDVPYKLPEIKGEIKTPTNKYETPIGKVDTVFIHGTEIRVPSPIDPLLKEELEKTKNAYQTLLEANRKRKYSRDFKDNNVDINVSASVYGKLDSMEVKYNIPEKIIKVPQTTVTKVVEKKDNFGFLALGGANINPKTQTTNFEAGVGVRVKNISILGTANTSSQVGIKIIAEF